MIRNGGLLVTQEGEYKCSGKKCRGTEREHRRAVHHGRRKYICPLCGEYLPLTGNHFDPISGQESGPHLPSFLLRTYQADSTVNGARFCEVFTATRMRMRERSVVLLRTLPGKHQAQLRQSSTTMNYLRVCRERDGQRERMFWARLPGVWRVEKRMFLGALTDTRQEHADPLRHSRNSGSYCWGIRRLPREGRYYNTSS